MCVQSSCNIFSPSSWFVNLVLNSEIMISLGILTVPSLCNWNGSAAELCTVIEGWWDWTLCIRHVLMSALICCRHASVTTSCKYQTNYSPIAGEDTFSPWLILWLMSPMSPREFVDVLMKGSVYQAQSTSQHVDPVSLTGENPFTTKELSWGTFHHMCKRDNHACWNDSPWKYERDFSWIHSWSVPVKVRLGQTFPGPLS